MKVAILIPNQIRVKRLVRCGFYLPLVFNAAMFAQCRSWLPGKQAVSHVQAISPLLPLSPRLW